MRIGVLSDTHGNLPTPITQAFAGCEYIFHAGDIGSLAVLLELEAIAPVVAVLGNNDFSFTDTLQQFELVELEGVRFLIAHRLEDLEYRLNNWPAGRVLPHVCIYGHTHAPKDFLRKPGGIRMINPGSLYYPRQGSRKQALVLEVSSGSIVEFNPIVL